MGYLFETLKTILAGFLRKITGEISGDLHHIVCCISDSPRVFGCCIFELRLHLGACRRFSIRRNQLFEGASAHDVLVFGPCWRWLWSSLSWVCGERTLTLINLCGAENHATDAKTCWTSTSSFRASTLSKTSWLLHDYNVSMLRGNLRRSYKFQELRSRPLAPEKLVRRPSFSSSLQLTAARRRTTSKFGRRRPRLPR